MFRRRTQERNSHGTVDGGEGRGVPLGGHDERPPTGYRSEDDDIDLGWDEDDDGRERRRDPLRKI
jgi:hypothetical protein